MFGLLNGKAHAYQYYLSSTDAGLKEASYNSRQEAESAMNRYCAVKGVTVSCVERDKHERLYESAAGATFCIARV